MALGGSLNQIPVKALSKYYCNILKNRLIVLKCFPHLELEDGYKNVVFSCILTSVSLRVNLINFRTIYSDRTITQFACDKNKTSACTVCKEFKICAMLPCKMYYVNMYCLFLFTLNVFVQRQRAGGRRPLWNAHGSESSATTGPLLDSRLSCMPQRSEVKCEPLFLFLRLLG